MGLEFDCGKCGHRLSSEETATAVACPDCGALLPPMAFDSVVAPRTPPERGDGAEPIDFTLQATDSEAPEGPESIFRLNDPDSESDLLESKNKTTVHDRHFSDMVLAAAAQTDAAPATETEPSAIPAKSEIKESPVTAGTTIATSRPPRVMSSAIDLRPVPSPAGPSPFLFRVAVSYASAVTLVCLYLLYLLFFPNPSVDLPDIKPHAPKESNRVTLLEYVRPENLLPKSHILRLGQSRRYGSVRITPLRVTKGPLEFAFSDPAVPESRPASENVLQLHLRMENVSGDQEFAPIDRQLVFTKEPDGRKFGWYKANNFLCQVDQRAAHDRHVMVYDLSPESSWLIGGSNLDHELKPGESIDVFIPTTEEGWESLSGDLVWRVHLRKGYNPQSLRGVTTLVEVLFNSAEIVDEKSALAGQTDEARLL